MKHVSIIRRSLAGVVIRSLMSLSFLYGASAEVHADVAIQSLHSIRSAAEAFVREQIPGDSKTAVVTAAELDPRLRLPKCAAPLHAAMTQGAKLQSRTPIGVSCRSGSTWTVYVPVAIESEIDVLVLKDSAARGARLTADNVSVQQRRVSGFAAAYVTDAAALAGHTLKRSLPSGTALTVDVLTADFVVRKGQQVTLLATTGSFEVRAYGRALSDGHNGARIKAQNLSSNKVVEGTVDGSGVIRVGR
jgi:flagella basal body P-ring formation protein FlgA